MTGFTDEIIGQLTAKLKATHVAERQQAGRKLSYIESWHAIAEANRIFGFDRWDRTTIEMREVDARQAMLGRAPQQYEGYKVAYVAKVRVEVLAGDHRIVREGTGFGQGIDRDCGLAHESAAKEAESDAMKRALMTFGNPFGLALYDKKQENVDSDTDSPTLEGKGELVAGPAGHLRVRPPAGVETPMPQGAMIEPGQVWAVDTADLASLAGADAKAFAKAASKPYQPRRAMGGPAPSLLQRATAEADKSSFDYEHFWTAILSPEERKEIGAEVHKQLKALAELADKRAALAS
jgi:DNA recombination protein Rad52